MYVSSTHLYVHIFIYQDNKAFAFLSIHLLSYKKKSHQFKYKLITNYLKCVPKKNTLRGFRKKNIIFFNTILNSQICSFISTYFFSVKSSKIAVVTKNRTDGTSGK